MKQRIVFIVAVYALLLQGASQIGAQGATIADRYPEVVALEITTVQDLALQVEFKTILNGVPDAQTGAFPKSPGEYLASLIQERILKGFVDNRVTGEQQARLLDALAKADDAHKQQVAAVLGVDLTITPPPVKK